MHVKFWGTRGSLPVALMGEEVEAKLRNALQRAQGLHLDTPQAIDEFMQTELRFFERSSYGGNSSCVEILAQADAHFICDLGSGVRAFSQDLLRRQPGDAQTINVFVSHVHWDHIMGFPFFTHAYIPGNKIRIHGSHAVLEEALKEQQSQPCFPVPFSVMAADIEFVTLTPGKTYDIDGVGVTNLLQPHGGDSYGYRFEQAGKRVVYSTDGEHKLENDVAIAEYVAFIKDADLVIFDAMYSLAETVSVKQDWGHSSNIVGVDLCHLANAKHYCMFHHEPIYNDAMIEKVLHETVRYEEITRENTPLQVSSAYDGMVIAV